MKSKKMLSITVYQEGEDARTRFEVGVVSASDEIKRATLGLLVGTVFDCFTMLRVDFASILGPNDMKRLSKDFAREIKRRASAPAPSPSPAQGGAREGVAP